MSDWIPLSVPDIGELERQSLLVCVESGFVSSVGPLVAEFESAFADFIGSRHAVACASGTAALHVALSVVGARHGTTVAVSDLTFIASVNSLSYTGAAPLLVDSERQTWNLDTELLHHHVQDCARRGMPLPVAIEPVHVLGNPAHLEPLLDLRERYGIRIVEDAAEALGATIDGGRIAREAVGAVGDFGCFSFNGNKVMTTGGGGMITTDDPALAERARHLTTQAKMPGAGYVHDQIGFNYRMTNLAAALGLAQLKRLPAFLERKAAIATRYNEAFEPLPTITTLKLPSWATGSHWLYTVLVEGARARDGLIERLGVAGIEARPMWCPVSQQAPYRDAERLGGEISADLSARGVSLPCSVGISNADQDRVIELVQSLCRA